MNQEFFSVLVQVAAALGLAGMILLLSILMGKRSSVRKPADIPYECGMIPMGEGAPMFSVKFYMVAMLFVILTWKWYSSTPGPSISGTIL